MVHAGLMESHPTVHDLWVEAESNKYDHTDHGTSCENATGIYTVSNIYDGYI